MATKEKLIEGLNRDLALELGAVIRYIYQYSVATGIGGEELREMLKPDIPEELNHALFLADKIFILGGEPTTTPAPFEKQTDVKAMLEYNLTQERDAIENYKKRIAQAEEFGDVGLKVKLENIVAEETKHAEETERLLKGF